MVQITSSVLIAFLLVAPSLALPVLTQEEFEARAEELAARDPSFGSIFRKIKKIARPAASIASLVLREEAPEAYERDFEDVDFEEMLARDPSFGSFFRKIKKIARPAAGIASLVLREESPEAYERAFDDIDFEELAARDPSFKSIFGKIKSAFTKKNVQKVEGVASKVGKIADLVIRDEDAELLERDLEDLEELAARDPSFGSIFRKIKKIASPKNLSTVARVASLVIRDGEQLTEREIAQLDELAERDPSFGSWIRKVGHSVGKVVNAKNIGTVAKVASYVIREDSDDVFERDYSDFVLNELD